MSQVENDQIVESATEARAAVPSASVYRRAACASVSGRWSVHITQGSVLNPSSTSFLAWSLAMP